MPDLASLPATAVFTASYLAGFWPSSRLVGSASGKELFISDVAGTHRHRRGTALAIASRLLLTVTELGAAVPFLLFPAGRPRVAH